MKLSVVVNSTGEIVAASIPKLTAPIKSSSGPCITTQFKLPDGHKAHDVSLPAELAKALLEGRFSNEFRHYKFSDESGDPVLKRVPARS